MAMRMRLSVARMRKGGKPIPATRSMRERSGRSRPMRMGGLRKRNQRLNAQLKNWERTVATAAPATPMSRAKMNTGSRTMLATAPMRTAAMPTVLYPWQVMK